MSTVIIGEAISEYNYINRITSAVAFALLYYDFGLTIPQEVERYWTGKLTWPSFLFFVNRYTAVLGHIPVIIEFSGVLSECLGFHQYRRFISVFISGVAAALMLLRTYALYVHDRRVLALLLALIGIGVSVSIWVLVVGRLTRRPAVTYAETIARTGCVLALSQEEGDDLAIAWSAIMVFDVAVFVLTFLQALQVRKTWCGGYFGVILRDGTAYFAILFFCYLSNILSYTLAKPMYKSISTTITNVRIAALLHSVSSTLITRLMLNIRDPALRGGRRIHIARRTSRVDSPASAWGAATSA